MAASGVFGKSGITTEVYLPPLHGNCALRHRAALLTWSSLGCCGWLACLLTIDSGEEGFSSVSILSEDIGLIIPAATAAVRMAVTDAVPEADDAVSEVDFVVAAANDEVPLAVACAFETGGRGTDAPDPVPIESTQGPSPQSSSYNSSSESSFMPLFAFPA